MNKMEQPGSKPNYYFTTLIRKVLGAIAPSRYPAFGAALVLGLCNGALASDEVIDVFTKHSDYQSIKISPDGKSLAIKMQRDETNRIVFMDAKTLMVTGYVKALNGDDIHSYRWLNNERISYRFSKKIHGYDRPQSYGQVLAINKDLSHRRVIYGLGTKQIRDLLAGGTRQVKRSNAVRKATLEIISRLPSEREHILIAEYPWSRKGRDFYDARNIPPVISKLNIYSGQRKKLEVLPLAGAVPYAGESGNIRFFTHEDKELTTDVYYRADVNSDWKPIALADLGENAHILGGSRDGRIVYIESELAGNPIWHKLDSRNMVLTPILSEQKVPIVSWFFDSVTGAPAVGLSEPDKFHYSYIDDSPTAKRHKMLARSFKGKRVEFLSSSDSGNETVVAVSSDTMPTDFYLFYAKNKEARYLMSRQSWINPELMQAKSPVKLKARDGVEVQGYYTKAWNKKNAPLLVLPHGGPHGVRNYWRFNSEVQLMARKGFNVLQLNFRGSGGYGEEFRALGYKQWGGTMIDDIIDGTQHVIQQYDLNADKVCIYGASYGAFAALMSSVKAPDLFRCAVGFAGVFDLEMMFEKGDILVLNNGENFLGKVLGTNVNQLKANSPVNNADKIKARILLVVGKKDKRAPIDQSEAMRKALVEAGNPPEWFKFNQAQHGVYSEENQAKLYQKILSFLEENLNPKDLVSAN